MKVKKKNASVIFYNNLQAVNNVIKQNKTINAINIIHIQSVYLLDSQLKLDYSNAKNKINVCFRYTFSSLRPT